ncbi:uncharacterized protein LOC105636001 isoform X2 [Jatropha curcas]|uniref:uncharacterized protein LOC105636001 isoform X2 n=1 Tax=Jatropha curcas TaxID=180498 RepID=UPI0005FB260C|nr:uncharacterized protein LOC105636001 isoform X2 [Jatropha curcas]
MAKIETLGILEEIEALVSDKLQVVSYKWLSRNFLVSSNVAKRLLQEFVEQHKSGLEVVYTLSGWLKNDPQGYHIRLVSGTKLEDSKQDFDGNCSIHVYSVQAAIPKDAAALWNDEFVQAEELFRQPFAADNCLRDNRFCGVRNPFVKRNVDGTPVSNAAAQNQSMGISGPSKSNLSSENNMVLLAHQIKVEQSGPKVGPQSSNLVKDVKIESLGRGVHNQSSKPHSDREKAHPNPSSGKNGQSDKNSNENGGSLASLWGRASAKSKPNSAPAENNSLISNPTEAQISAHEAIEDRSSDDEAQDVNFKRASNGDGGRKRRVVFDYSDDEYEDAVSLASPDLPKGKIGKTSPEKPNFNDQMEDKPKVKEEKSTYAAFNQVVREKSSVSSKSNSRDSSKENIHSSSTGEGVKADIVTNGAPSSPKRRKVLKTHIDARGREVTEVVWEGEETETKKAERDATKKAESDATKKAENNASINTVNNRAPAAKKSGALGSSKTGSKTGNKKGVNKDAKQGNILSFFKRV